MQWRLKRWQWGAVALVLVGSAFSVAIAASSRPTSEELVERALGRSVDADSASWFFNRYDHGSLADLEFVKREGTHSIIVRANYTFNDGQRGWVMARVIDGQIECLQYWDKNFCKPVGAFAAYAASRAGQTPSASGDGDSALLDCMINHGLVGAMCKESGIGMEAGTENEARSGDSGGEPPVESPPEPEQHMENEGGGGEGMSGGGD